MDLSEYAPAWSQQLWHGMPIWAWVGMPVRFIVAYFLAILAGRSFLWVVNHLAARREGIRDFAQAIVPPVELMVAIAFFKAGREFLPLGAKAGHYVEDIELVGGTFATGWLLFRLADVFGRRTEASLARKGRRQAVAIIPLLRRLIKGAIMLLTLLFLLQNLGYNVSAMLAGLGIGGVAIALAAQKTVENLFGGVMLVLDQPIRVGDFGIFDKYVGTVEDIGLRSTRIRTLDRTIVTIPNGDFSQLKLESFTARDRLLFKAVIGLTYDTPNEALQKVIASIEDLLKSDERVMPGFHFKFTGYNSSSIDFELFAYIKTSNWDEFLAIREGLMLEINERVRQNGSDFAFPSQTVYNANAEEDAETQDKPILRQAQHEASTGAAPRQAEK